MYTRKLRTRLFIRKNADDDLLQLFRAKERSIQFWIEKQGTALHRADDLYRENLALRKRIAELEAAIPQATEALPPLLQLLADTKKRSA